MQSLRSANRRSGAALEAPRRDASALHCSAPNTKSALLDIGSNTSKLPRSGLQTFFVARYPRRIATHALHLLQRRRTQPCCSERAADRGATRSARAPASNTPRGLADARACAARLRAELARRTLRAVSPAQLSRRSRSRTRGPRSSQATRAGPAGNARPAPCFLECAVHEPPSDAEVHAVRPRNSRAARRGNAPLRLRAAQPDVRAAPRLTRRGERLGFTRTRRAGASLVRSPKPFLQPPPC